MDRKSFFKRALFAVGAAVVPNVILNTIDKSGKWSPAEAEEAFSHKLTPVVRMHYSEEGSETLYWQMERHFREYDRTVKAKEFYWAEFDCGPYEFKLQELKKFKNV